MHTADSSHAVDGALADHTRPLRLLFVADKELWPLHSGSHQRLHELATGLAQRHEVTVVMLSHYQRLEFPGAERFAALHVVPYDTCPVGRPDYQPAGPLAGALSTIRTHVPDMARGWRSDALMAVLRDLNAPERFDVTWATRTYFAEQAMDAGLDPVIVDVDDVPSVLVGQQRPSRRFVAKRMAHEVERRAVRAWQLSVTSRAAVAVVCKDDDAEILGGARTAIVPNGVTVPEHAAGTGERPDEILFVGSLDWGPNIDAVCRFASDVLPIIRRVRPSTRFVVAGKLPRPEVAALHDGDGCVVVADPPGLGDLYRRATVVVVPMRHGSGTRLKVLEAIAHGKALVSTAVGAEGIDVTSGVHYVRAELTDDFALACLRLMADRDERERLGTEGRAWAIEHAQWSHAVERADEVVQLTARSRSPSHGAS